MLDWNGGDVDNRPFRHTRYCGPRPYQREAINPLKEEQMIVRRLAAVVASVLGFWAVWKVLIFDAPVGNPGFTHVFTVVAFVAWVFTAFWGLIAMFFNWPASPIQTMTGFLALAVAIALSAAWAILNTGSFPTMPPEVAWWIGSWILVAIADLAIWQPISGLEKSRNEI